jgi:hypothetical protein
MKLKWDFQEFIDFKNNFRSIQKVEMLKRITKDIGKALLKRVKSLTPVGQTYDLINGWNGNHFIVTERNNGYEVLIVNRDKKASWVNDGHRSFNQYGGPYKINPHGFWNKGKPRGRVQVRSPYKWQDPVSEYYVYGHFFVERGILQLKNTQEIEQIIMKELQKWWDSL